MEWLEVSVKVENEAAEVVAEVLSRYAYRGVAIEAGPDGWGAGPVIVRAYLPADDQLPANKRRVQEALWHLGQIRPIPEPAFRPIAEADWVNAWKERLDVLRIGRRIVVRPSWRDYAPEPDDIVIQLDPGMAFGTGLHPTTQMCLMALEEFVLPGMTVLDMGTGSGLLSIAAAKLGAGHVFAVDNDPVAVQTARANVVANGVQKTVDVACGSLEDVQESYGLVVVNILAKVIINMAQQGLSARVVPGGRVVAAGIIVDQDQEVVSVMEQNGLSLVKRRQIGDWVCLLAEKHSTP